MSELKSAKFAEKHGLIDKLALDEKTGVISASEDYYEASLPEGVSIDLVKKLQKHNSELLAATTLVGGEMAAKAFAGNEDLTEVSFKYSAGHDHYNGFYTRGDTNPVRNVVEVHGCNGRGEMGKVYKHVKSLFDEL